MNEVRNERNELSSSAWLDIDSAPEDGTEILVWSESTGTLLARWIAPAEFMTEKELDSWSEEGMWESDWFCADFVEGGRLDCMPTHWMPLPSFRSNIEDAHAKGVDAL